MKKLTSLPAGNLGIAGRGSLEPGHFADVVIFDPETIIDHATYEDPHQYATGRVHVFVNGAQVLADGPLAVGLSASAPPCELPGEGAFSLIRAGAVRSRGRATLRRPS